MIGFVGRKDDVKLRILQFQPGQVAGEVIVAEQRVGAQAKKLRECRIVAEFGRRPQSFCRRLQKGAKCNVVGNGLQFVLLPAHDGELIVDRCLLLRMLLDVLLDLIARQVRGIEASARRHGFGADKRLVLIYQIEAGSVDPQIAAQFDIAPVLARGQRLVQDQALGIALPPVDTFEIAAGLHQFANQLLLASAETGRMKGIWTRRNFASRCARSGATFKFAGAPLLPPNQSCCLFSSIALRRELSINKNEKQNSWHAVSRTR